MTKKQKQIEEMAEIIRAENERMFNFHDGYICTPHDQAKALYKSKYRHVKEVRSEIAKQVLKDLKERTIWFFMGMPQSAQNYFWKQFEEMCKLFGVKINTKTKSYTEAQTKEPIIKTRRPIQQSNTKIQESETGQKIINFLKSMDAAAKKIEELEEIRLQGEKKK